VKRARFARSQHRAKRARFTLALTSCCFSSMGVCGSWFLP
jgi:hypothetical protein